MAISHLSNLRFPLPCENRRLVAVRFFAPPAVPRLRDLIRARPCRGPKHAQTVRVLATSRGVDPEGQRTAAFASEGRSANTRRNHGASRERRRAALVPSARRPPRLSRAHRRRFPKFRPSSRATPTSPLTPPPDPNLSHLARSQGLLSLLRRLKKSTGEVRPRSSSPALLRRSRGGERHDDRPRPGRPARLRNLR